MLCGALCCLRQEPCLVSPYCRKLRTCRTRARCVCVLLSAGGRYIETYSACTVHDTDQIRSDQIRGGRPAVTKGAHPVIPRRSMAPMSLFVTFFFVTFVTFLVAHGVHSAFSCAGSSQRFSTGFLCTILIQQYVLPSGILIIVVVVNLSGLS